MLLRTIEGHTLFERDLSADSVVLDLGANQGRFSRGMIDRFGCRCYAVEANPEMCGRIEPGPSLRVFNLAVAGTPGEVTLNVSSNSEESSILATGGRGTTHAIQVRAVRLDELLREIGVGRVDLIKLDIEGAEIQVLDSCSDEFLSRVPQLTVEFHDFLGVTPVATVERVVQRLRSLGFAVIKMWRSGHGDTLFINRRLSTATGLDCLWGRYVIRNWRGLKRVASRVVGNRWNGLVARPDRRNSGGA